MIITGPPDLSWIFRNIADDAHNHVQPLRAAAAACRTYAARIENVPGDCDTILATGLANWDGPAKDAFLLSWAVNFTGTANDGYSPGSFSQLSNEAIAHGTPLQPILPALHSQILDTADQLEDLASKIEQYVIACKTAQVIDLGLAVLSVVLFILTIEIGGEGGLVAGLFSYLGVDAAATYLAGQLVAWGLGWVVSIAVPIVTNIVMPALEMAFISGMIDLVSQEVKNTFVWDPYRQSIGEPPAEVNWVEVADAALIGAVSGAVMGGFGGIAGALLKPVMQNASPILRQVITRSLGALLGGIGDVPVQLTHILGPEHRGWDWGEFGSSVGVGALLGGRIGDLFTQRPTLIIDSPDGGTLFMAPDKGLTIDPDGPGISVIDPAAGGPVSADRWAFNVIDPETGRIIGHASPGATSPDDPSLRVVYNDGTVKDYALNGSTVHVLASEKVGVVDGPATSEKTPDSVPLKTAYDKHIAYSVEGGKARPLFQTDALGDRKAAISAFDGQGDPHPVEVHEKLTDEMKVQVVDSTGGRDVVTTVELPKDAWVVYDRDGSVIAATRPMSKVSFDSSPSGLGGMRPSRTDRSSTELYMAGSDRQLRRLGFIRRNPVSGQFEFYGDKWQPGDSEGLFTFTGNGFEGMTLRQIPDGLGTTTIAVGETQRFSYGRLGEVEPTFPAPARGETVETPPQPGRTVDADQPVSPAGPRPMPALPEETGNGSTDQNVVPAESAPSGQTGTVTETPPVTPTADVPQDPVKSAVPVPQEPVKSTGTVSEVPRRTVESIPGEPVKKVQPSTAQTNTRDGTVSVETPHTAGKTPVPRRQAASVSSDDPLTALHEQASNMLDGLGGRPVPETYDLRSALERLRDLITRLPDEHPRKQGLLDALDDMLNKRSGIPAGRNTDPLIRNQLFRPLLEQLARLDAGPHEPRLPAPDGFRFDASASSGGQAGGDGLVPKQEESAAAALPSMEKSSEPANLRVETMVPGLWEEIDPGRTAVGPWKFKDYGPYHNGDTVSMATKVTNGEVPGTGTLIRILNTRTGELSYKSEVLKFPDGAHWVRHEREMVPGRGTPLETYITMRQMKRLAEAAGDPELFTRPHEVVVQDIANVRTILRLARLEQVWQAEHPGLPFDRNQAIEATHSVRYAKNSITQSGGKVTAVWITGGNAMTAEALIRTQGYTTAAEQAKLLQAYGVAPGDQVLADFAIHLQVEPAHRPPLASGDAGPLENSPGEDAPGEDAPGEKNVGGEDAPPTESGPAGGPVFGEAGSDPLIPAPAVHRAAPPGSTAAPEIVRPRHPDKSRLVYPYDGLVHPAVRNEDVPARSNVKAPAGDHVPALLAEMFVAGDDLGIVEDEVRNLLPWIRAYTVAFGKEVLTSLRAEPGGTRILVSHSAVGENPANLDVAGLVKGYEEPIPILHTHTRRSHAAPSTTDHHSVTGLLPYGFVAGPVTPGSEEWAFVQFGPAPTKAAYRQRPLTEFFFGKRLRSVLAEQLRRAAEQADQRMTALPGGPVATGAARAHAIVDAVDYLSEVTTGGAAFAMTSPQGSAFADLLFQLLDTPGGPTAEQAARLERAAFRYARGEAFAPDIDALSAFRATLLSEYEDLWPTLSDHERSGLPTPADLPGHADEPPAGRRPSGRNGPAFGEPHVAPRRRPAPQRLIEYGGTPDGPDREAELDRIATALKLWQEQGPGRLTAKDRDAILGYIDGLLTDAEGIAEVNGALRPLAQRFEHLANSLLDLLHDTGALGSVEVSKPGVDTKAYDWILTARDWVRAEAGNYRTRVVARVPLRSRGLPVLNESERARLDRFLRRATLHYKMEFGYQLAIDMDAGPGEPIWYVVVVRGGSHRVRASSVFVHGHPQFDGSESPWIRRPSGEDGDIGALRDSPYQAAQIVPGDATHDRIVYFRSGKYQILRGESVQVPKLVDSVRGAVKTLTLSKDVGAWLELIDELRDPKRPASWSPDPYTVRRLMKHLDQVEEGLPGEEVKAALDRLAGGKSTPSDRPLVNELVRHLQRLARQTQGEARRARLELSAHFPSYNPRDPAARRSIKPYWAGDEVSAPHRGPATPAPVPPDDAERYQTPPTAPAGQQAQQPGTAELKAAEWAVEQARQFRQAQLDQIRYEFAPYREALERLDRTRSLPEAVRFVRALRARYEQLRQDVRAAAAKMDAERQEAPGVGPLLRKDAERWRRASVDFWAGQARESAGELALLTRIERLTSVEPLPPEMEALLREYSRTLSPEAADELGYALRVHLGFQRRDLVRLLTESRDVLQPEPVNESAAVLRDELRRVNDALAEAWRSGTEHDVQELEAVAGSLERRLRRAATPASPADPQQTVARAKELTARTRAPRLKNLDALTTYLRMRFESPVENMEARKKRREGLIRLVTELIDVRERLSVPDLTGANRRERVRLEARLAQVLEDLSRWRVTGPTAEPTPPETVMVVAEQLIDPVTEKPIPGRARTVPMMIDNVASPSTSKNPLAWAGAKITQIGESTGHYRVTRHSLNPYGGVLPVTGFNETRYRVEMPDGSVHDVTAREDFQKVELRSPTEMLRYSGSLAGGPFTDLFGTFPIWSRSIDLFDGDPNKGYNILLIPRTYAAMETGLLLPGSDDVHRLNGKIDVDVRTVRPSAHGRYVLPKAWSHSEPVTSKGLIADSPGPRMAPQHKYDLGVGLLLVFPIMYKGIQVAAVGGVLQFQYTNENKAQLKTAGLSRRQALRMLAAGRFDEKEHGVSREFVLSMFFSMGGQNPFVPQPSRLSSIFGGFNLSGVPLAYVAGRSVGSAPDVVDRILMKAPWVGRRIRANMEAATRAARTEIRRLARARVADEERAELWLPGLRIDGRVRLSPPVLDHLRKLADDGHAVRVGRRYGTATAPEVLIDGREYGIHRPESGDPDHAATGLKRAYDRLVAAPSHIEELPVEGMIVDLSHVPASANVQQVTTRLSALAGTAGMPEAVIIVGPGGLSLAKRLAAGLLAEVEQAAGVPDGLVESLKEITRALEASSEAGAALTARALTTVLQRLTADAQGRPTDQAWSQNRDVLKSSLKGIGTLRSSTEPSRPDIRAQGGLGEEWKPALHFEKPRQELAREQESVRTEPDPPVKRAPERSSAEVVPAEVAEVIRKEAAKLVEQARRRIAEASADGSITQDRAAEAADLIRRVERLVLSGPGAVRAEAVRSHADAVGLLREHLAALPSPRSRLRTASIASARTRTRSAGEGAQAGGRLRTRAYRTSAPEDRPLGNDVSSAPQGEGVDLRPQRTVDALAVDFTDPRNERPATIGDVRVLGGRDFVTGASFRRGAEVSALPLTPAEWKWVLTVMRDRLYDNQGLEHGVLYHPATDTEPAQIAIASGGPAGITPPPGWLVLMHSHPYGQAAGNGPSISDFLALQHTPYSHTYLLEHASRDLGRPARIHVIRRDGTSEVIDQRQIAIPEMDPEYAEALFDAEHLGDAHTAVDTALDGLETRPPGTPVSGELSKLLRNALAYSTDVGPHDLDAGILRRVRLGGGPDEADLPAIHEHLDAALEAILRAVGGNRARLRLLDPARRSDTLNARAYLRWLSRRERPPRLLDDAVGIDGRTGRTTYHDQFKAIIRRAVKAAVDDLPADATAAKLRDDLLNWREHDLLLDAMRRAVPAAEEDLIQRLLDALDAHDRMRDAARTAAGRPEAGKGDR
ncbi:hypothetical protein [Actinoallomurus soli]|uniref:hypothetical protein n=1 Tax=Actinoallomurus soli TaxID=2952535 RepID=UPI002093C1B4|nr:hypothetical protein [Actinoallomurus soli]MCO5971380.1 hypothetical protein [Actinoallomurus soli]